MDSRTNNLSSRLKSTQKNTAVDFDEWSKKFNPGVLGRYKISQRGPSKHVAKRILDEDLSKKVTKMSGGKEEPFHLLNMACYAWAVSKYTGVDETVLGTHDFLSLDMTASLPMQLSVKKQESFKRFLLSLRTEYLDAIRYKGFAMDLLLEKLGLQSTKDLLATNYGPVSMGLANSDSQEEVEEKPSLFAEQNEGKIEISFFFGEEINIDTERFLDHYVNVLTQVMNDPERLYIDTSLVDENEQLRLTKIGTGATLTNSNNYILDDWSKHVDLTPDALALAGKEGTMTYIELQKWSDQISAYIEDHYEIQEGAVIAVLCDKGMWQIGAMLSTLKLGASFITIDPKLPKERVEYILKDAQVSLLISHTVRTITWGAGNQWDVKEGPFDFHYSKILTPRSRNPKSGAYMIYTSGTTGNPKGTLVTHEAFMNMIIDQRDQLGITAEDRILQFASASFDASLYDIFLALLSGASLVLTDAELIERPERFENFMKEFKVSFMVIPPVYLAQLNKKKLESARVVCVSGELPILSDLKELVANGVRCFNVYGPSETAVVVSSYEVQVTDEEPLPIGRPIANTTFLVLDEDHNLLPEGVKGELCIAGANLGNGYHDMPELTAEKFIKKSNGHEVIYKTGDLAYWNEDGMVVVTGRVDEQVKIRGHRIEPLEVQLRLGNIQGIDKSVVVSDKDKNDRHVLRAFYVAQHEMTPDEIKSVLEVHLPGYMLPSSFMPIDKIPLTHAGKVNKRKLLQLWKDHQTTKSDKHYTPKNQAEADVYEIWSSVLDNKIGIHEHFFNAGGDSIKAIQVAVRLMAKGYKTDIAEILTNPTVHKLSQVIKSQKSTVPDSAIEGDIPLSPIQRAFLESNHEEPSHFNQSVILKLKKPVNSEKIKEAFTIIFNQHDTLRILFQKKENGVNQYNRASDISFEIGLYNFQKETDPLEALKERIAENQTTLDLTNGPLVRVDTYLTGEGQYIALTVHHLIIDAVSWSIVLSDLDQLLGLEETSNGVLPPKTTPWKEWCDKLEQHETRTVPIGNKIFDQIPYDTLGGQNIVKNTASVVCTIDKELTAQLDQEVHHRYRTNVQDFLLAALSKAIFQVWDVSNIGVEVETHGRSVQDKLDVSRTLGWFTCFYPFQIQRSDIEDNVQLIIKTKESLRHMQSYALDYMLHRGQLNSDEKPRILFNYLGTIGNSKFDAFEWSNIPTGATQSSKMERWHDWEINALIAEDQLHVNITYCKDQFSAERMDTVAAKMKEQLLELVKLVKAQSESLLTPADLVYQEISMSDLFELQQNHSAEDIYPLTPMQEGMYFHSLMHRKAGFYSTQLSYTLKGSLDVPLLKDAYGELISRHAGLRSCFVQDKKGKPWQIVLNTPNPEFEIEDLTHMSDDQASAHMNQLKELDKQRGFDLDEDAPMRIRVLMLGSDRNYFIWSYHHIIMDGWCMSILTAEWMRLYINLSEKRSDNLPAVTPYRDFISWRYEKDIDASYGYWAELLDGYQGAPDIPKTSRSMSTIDPAARVNKEVIIDREKSDVLRQLAQQFNTTLNVLIQGVWGVVLSRYTNTNDIVFGTVVSGRPSDLPGVESIVGQFINNIPVRTKMTEDQLFSSFLEELQHQSIASAEHQYCSLAEIQSRMPGAIPLVEHIMLFENFPSAGNVETSMGSGNDELSFGITDAEAHDINNYHFTLVVIPGDQIRIRINLNPQVHPEEIGEDILTYFTEIFERLEHGGDQAIEELAKIPSTMAGELLDNGSESKVDANLSTIPELFEATVAQFGERPALMSSEGAISYNDLDKVSNRVANLLIASYGIEKQDVVAVHLEKTTMAFQGIWGVLKSGGAYVPIDPSWPEERKQYVLENAGAKAIIALFDDFPELQNFNCKLLAIDIQSDDASISTSPIEVEVSPDDLAYIIYTSGSTGQPKGVPISHRSNINMALDQIRMFGIGSDDHVLQFAPLYFDASIYEWSIASYAGACLYVPEDKTLKNIELFNEYLAKNEISMATLPPAFFNVLDIEGTAWPRNVIQAGSAPNAQRTLEVSRMANCYNAYGPTECAVCIAVHPVSELDKELTVLPIGRPVSGNTIYILDDNLELMPVGVEGEICVSGVNLSPGYIDKDQNHVFVANPFVEGEKLYRTGDIGRWLPGYEIEYSGRKDRQLKVRGYRIEPLEVENAILKHKAIAQVVVSGDKDSDDLIGLVAYVVSTGKWKEKTLKSTLQGQIPSYMIPGRFVEIPEVPLTKNGKVDYELLSRQTQVGQEAKESVLPSNEVERELFKIWVEILGQEGFGVGDKFFEVGGNSLSLIRLHSQVKLIYPDISITDIFNHNTIEEMSIYISSVQNQERIIVEAGTSVNFESKNGLSTIQNINSESFEFKSDEWEAIVSKFKPEVPNCMNEDLLLSFFCFALYEQIEQPIINAVLLDKTARRLSGMLSLNFDKFESAEELLQFVVSRREGVVDELSNKLDAVHLQKNQQEVVMAFSHSYIPETTPVQMGDIDLLLKSEHSKSGDVRMSLHWKPMAIENGFVEGVKNAITNVVRNLTLA